MKLAREAVNLHLAGGSAVAAEDTAQQQRRRGLGPREKSRDGSDGPTTSSSNTHAAPTGNDLSAIRLPGSLDEHRMRRALTSTQLARNASHAKLKKNLSHGQLTRLAEGAGVTAAALGAGLTRRGPPSPGLKGRSKRPKSADFSAVVEKDLHEQEVEIAQQRAEARRDGVGGGVGVAAPAAKKVGFAVGSSASEEDVEDDDLPVMEGSGLQGEDEWTDQSASASPYSTRQNTANNSRRASVVERFGGERRGEGVEGVYVQSGLTQSQVAAEVDGQQGGISDGSSDDDRSSDNTSEKDDAEAEVPSEHRRPPAPPASIPPEEQQAPFSPPTSADPRPTRAKDDPKPSTLRLLHRTASTAAPALLSNISAQDTLRSNRASPTPSTTSSRSAYDPTTAETSPAPVGTSATPDLDSGELVSRFMPTGAHPGTAGGAGMNVNTPNSGSLVTPEGSGNFEAAAGKMGRSSDHDDNGTRQLKSTPANRDANPNSKRATFTIGPSTSPTSLRSHPSASTSASQTAGEHTPIMTPSASSISLVRSRNELRMINEKAIAEKEDKQAWKPIIPAHVYDRRNVSLRSGTAKSSSRLDRESESVRESTEAGRAGGASDAAPSRSASTSTLANSLHPGGVGQGGINTSFSSQTTLMMGPEIFQGRFKAVNAELKVVQRYRDVVGESLGRLGLVAKGELGIEFAKMRATGVKANGANAGGGGRSATTGGGKLQVSRSAVSLPLRQHQHQHTAVGKSGLSASSPRLLGRCKGKFSRPQKARLRCTVARLPERAK